MPIIISIPDLKTDTASFDKYFVSYSISKQSDGRGGFAWMATLTVNLLDSNGEVYDTASQTIELTPDLVGMQRSLIVANLLPPLKAKEGL